MNAIAAAGPRAATALAARTVPNLVGFQLAWLALVLGAAAGLWWAGALFGLGWLAFHLASLGARRRIDGALIALAGCVGALADSTLVAAGLLAFPEVSRVGPLAPPWMAVLWMAFAATLPHSLGWLARRPWLAAAAGAAAGPLAYRAGEALGAIALPAGAVSLLAVAAVYAVAMPGLALALAAIEARAPRARGA